MSSCSTIYASFRSCMHLPFVTPVFNSHTFVFSFITISSPIAVFCSFIAARYLEKTNRVGGQATSRAFCSLCAHAANSLCKRRKSETGSSNLIKAAFCMAFKSCWRVANAWRASWRSAAIKYSWLCCSTRVFHSSISPRRSAQNEFASLVLICFLTASFRACWFWRKRVSGSVIVMTRLYGVWNSVKNKKK